MAERLEAALRAGQVTAVEGGAYRCEVCENNYTSKSTVKNHLTTNKHRNKLASRSTATAAAAAGEASKLRPKQLSSPPPAKTTTCKVELDTLLDSSDEERLEAALTKGLVRELEGGAYRCEVCENNYTSKSTVKNHLTTNKHRTKLASRSTAATAAAAAAGEASKLRPKQLSSPPPAKTTTCKVELDKLLDSSNEEDDSEECESSQERLEAALRAGQVTPQEGGAYRCVVCENYYTSKSTVKNHLTTNKHSTKLSSLSPAEDVQRETFVQSSELGEHAAESESPMEKLEAALRAGQVTALEDGAYRCEVCENNYTSKSTVKNHLTTNKHRTKFQSFCGKKASKDRERTSGTLVTRGEMSPARRHPYCDDARDAKKFPPQPVEASGTPSEVVVPAQQPRDRYSDGVYHHNIELPPGRVYVFNYIYFRHDTRGKEDIRNGASKDSINLVNTFTELGYKVQVHENLTEKETMEAVQDITRDCTVEAPQALFVFFLSHGVNSKEFQAADGKLLNIDKLRNEFTSDRCPALAKKPKIFMTNYCRGTNEEYVEMDGRVKVLRNLVTIYASQDGIAAHRFPKEGTAFILSLCRVLKGLKERTELRDVYCLLTHEMQKGKSTSPNWEDFSFKKFYIEMPCKSGKLIRK